jgi:class 3 adenylate cyclase
MASDDFPIGFPEEMVSAFVELFQRTWGTEELAKIALPSFADQPDLLSTFMKYVRTSATPHSASIQFDYMFRSIDTRAVLPSIQVPTLVLHRSKSVFLPIEFGHFLAENIPGARFAEVPGEDVYCFGAHSDDVLAEIAEFVTGERPQEDLDRVLATVLFTDIVSSTQHLSTVGDRNWKEVLDRHDRMIRAQIERYRGREIDTTGDGFLAIFDGPARAIRCACAIRDDARTIGLEIRAGLHTGELELRGDGVAGIAVHLGARIAAVAEANEVLVSRTVADLVAGSGIALADRGEHDLKGIPDRWMLFAVVA